MKMSKKNLFCKKSAKNVTDVFENGKKYPFHFCLTGYGPDLCGGNWLTFRARIKILKNNEKTLFGIGRRGDARKFKFVQQDLHLQAVG